MVRETNPLYVFLYLLGADDDLAQDELYTCLLSLENAQFKHPALLKGCNATCG